MNQVYKFETPTLDQQTYKKLNPSHTHPSYLYGLPKLHKLLQLCLQTTYFTYDNEFYQKKQGAAMGSPLFPMLTNIYLHGVFFCWRTGLGESRQETITMAQMCGWHICYLATWPTTPAYPATLSTSSQLPQTLYQIHCVDKEGWYTSFPGCVCDLQSTKSHHTDHIVQSTNAYRSIYPLSILPLLFHQDWNHSNPAPLIKDHMPRSRLTGFSSYCSLSTEWISTSLHPQGS